MHHDVVTLGDQRFGRGMAQPVGRAGDEHAGLAACI
jgi:hypothetical protein